jgi:ABC-type multidrug transport system fused ATPase/permease subunit
MSFLDNLCTPAFLYTIISIFLLFILAFSYLVNTSGLSFIQIVVIFLFKIIFIVFLIFVLNFLCNKGYTGMSWFLFLLPYFIIFIVVSYLATINNNIQQQNNNKTSNNKTSNNKTSNNKTNINKILWL